ncbi:MAG: redox-sensing transcriptional repressor Rex [Anaerolineae bacterium]
MRHSAPHKGRSARATGLPGPTLARLPFYYRRLLRALDEGQEIVSSEDLGQEADVPAAQARKDLSYLGEFGRPGVGYNAESLADHLGEFLGLTRDRTAIIVGAGRLGMALAAYTGFARYGLHIEALFDIDPGKFKQRVGSKPILPMSSLGEWFQKHRVDLSIIAVPAFAAQAVADRLVEAGARAIWNFTPREIQVPPHVYVQNEDLGTRLAIALYHLRIREEEEEAG